MYRQYKSSRNRYVNTTQTQEVPAKWSPIQVIRTAEWIIKLQTKCTYDPQQTQENHGIIGRFNTKHERQVIGQFEIAMDQLPVSREKWEKNQLKLYCGADGGLKDSVGTNGYNLFIDREDNPLVYGHAAEIQADNSASSTRQYLLAQIAIEYWIRHLVEYLGSSDHPIKVVMVTDSSTSISTVEGF